MDRRTHGPTRSNPGTRRRHLAEEDVGPRVTAELVLVGCAHDVHGLAEASHELVGPGIAPAVARGAPLVAAQAPVALPIAGLDGRSAIVGVGPPLSPSRRSCGSSPVRSVGARRPQPVAKPAFPTEPAEVARAAARRPPCCPRRSTSGRSRCQPPPTGAGSRRRVRPRSPRSSWRTTRLVRRGRAHRRIPSRCSPRSSRPPSP